jgi:hypothetical protein
VPSRARVLVIVNKWWECDPLLGVLLHDQARATPHLKWPRPLHHPHKRPSGKLPSPSHTVLPRAVFSLERCSVEVWCISDFLESLADLELQSSSSEKVKALAAHKLFAEVPALVMAVGTAACPSPESHNGCVFIGSRVFVHNAFPNNGNRKSTWVDKRFDRMVASSLNDATFYEISDIAASTWPLFLSSPNAPAATRVVHARPDYVAVGNVNVTNYADYDIKDPIALQAVESNFPDALIGSLETTHGLIRMQSEAPFLFVSGIVDRVGHFAEDVGTPSYAQNFVGAHNAGVAVAWMMAKLDAALDPSH